MNVNELIKKKLFNVTLPLYINSDTRFIFGLSFLEKFARKKDKHIFEKLKEFVKNKHPSIELAKYIYNEHDKNCVNKLTNNLILNGIITKAKKKYEKMDRIENWSPTTLLISPTMRCNLKCTGCYADQYSKDDDMSYELLDRIIKEARDMNVGFFTILGGEPFIRKDIFDIFEKYNDCYFQVYTNGCLITEEMCKKLLKVGNVMPQISIEGFENETDSRRGRGTYEKVLKAMDLLKKYKIPFGCSVCVTSKNQETVFSDKFIDMLIEKGAIMAWYFLFMPVCGNPDMSLMPTPDQRINMLDRGKYIRNNKRIFIIDFWNDAPFVGGCIAGKEYLHITQSGDVEPCIFTHFSVDNIKNKSLMEVFNSEYFKDLRRNQPYTDNLYMPCQWIDNPKVSREMFEKHNLRATHEGADDILKNEELKKGIDKYSKEIKEKYDKIWNKEKHKFKK